MTRNLRLLVLPALLIAFDCASVSVASQSDCLPYEPNSVQLTGRILKGVFPGPPNYESVKEGDKPEGAWILHYEEGKPPEEYDLLSMLKRH